MDKKEKVNVKYRCCLCRYVLNQHYEIIKEQEEYKKDILPYAYCKNCHDTILKEKEQYK